MGCDLVSCLGLRCSLALKETSVLPTVCAQSSQWSCGCRLPDIPVVQLMSSGLFCLQWQTYHPPRRVLSFYPNHSLSLSSYAWVITRLFLSYSSLDLLSPIRISCGCSGEAQNRPGQGSPWARASFGSLIRSVGFPQRGDLVGDWSSQCLEDHWSF